MAACEPMSQEGPADGEADARGARQPPIDLSQPKEVVRLRREHEQRNDEGESGDLEEAHASSNTDLNGRLPAEIRADAIKERGG